MTFGRIGPHHTGIRENGPTVGSINEYFTFNLQVTNPNY